MTGPEVVALGEALLRLSPPSGQTLETARTLDLHVGGSELNTLVGLARLDHTTSFLSRLPDNLLGRRVAGTARAQGVDTRYVTLEPSGRVGCYWYDAGGRPRDAAVVYDRAGSAMTTYRPSDLPDELFELPGRRTFHTTGITLALSDSARQAALAAMRKARAAGWQVSFDSNDRRLLWPTEVAAEALTEAADLADILIVPFADAATVLGLDGGAGAEGVLEQLRQRFPHPIIAVTDGARGAAASAPGGPLLRQAPFPIEAVDRIGRGDAFTAGLLHGLLGGGDGADGLQHALRWGAAMAALAYATPGDMPLVDVHAAERLVDEAAA